MTNAWQRPVNIFENALENNIHKWPWQHSATALTTFIARRQNVSFERSNISTKQLVFQGRVKIVVNNPQKNIQYSGVTTMGSDRENPGAPNLNGPNGGPQV
jgi:hypothetical protein